MALEQVGVEVYVHCGDEAVRVTLLSKISKIITLTKGQSLHPASSDRYLDEFFMDIKLYGGLCGLFQL